MDITAAMVQDLRKRTGIGMMECKSALTEADGDMAKAITILRKKGYARAEKKSTRETSEGIVGSYIHANLKIGVLIEVNCETDFVARNEEFQEMVKNIAMHIAAADPRYISSNNIPEEGLAEEKDIIRGQLKDSNKPPEIMEKIVEGKLNKYFQEVCLLNQTYIKDDKMSIEDLVKSFIAKTGENVVISRFARYQIGD
ncbi:MAG: translation elongation factor Ts [Acidobacteria bacterium]|nr:translation elongation factor Ts [Acidobacteriota bacterium]MCG2815495.1 translation elongation factor Ts [Candidatus Aminicenantes bacterium]MBU1339901.1 translation elongation factor Ts [Acidobacteriota bacterium]MBU1474285.1 translation elongation factor Ts [Acidobacteriota bacterium]MBU2437644.1 translation elongation factor Ts [Acidobacteriota bacterium]